MTVDAVVSPDWTARSVAALLAALAVVFAAGCASPPPVAPVVVPKAVAVACPTAMPPRPAFPVDRLTGNEDIWTIGTALWADRKARQAYELELEVRLRGCTQLDFDSSGKE